MTHLNELCDLITSKYNIEYIIIDENYRIQSFSHSINRLLNTQMHLCQVNNDVREILYELIGYEEVIDQIHTSQLNSFSISTVNRNNFYIDIFMKYLKNSDHIAILIDDVTPQAQKERLLLQDRHEKELLLKELASKNYLLNKYKKAAQEAIPMLHLDPMCQIKDININFLNLLGRSRSTLKYQHFNELIDEDHTFDRSAILQDMYENKVHHTTLKLITKDNNTLYINAIFVPMFDERKLKEILLFADDITSHKVDNSNLQEIAYHDALTGVLNRVGFDQQLDALIESQQTFAVMFLDLDFFKKVNDTYGHYYGDQVLQHVAKRASSHIGSDDIIARYGGDEFILIINNTYELDIKNLAQKVIDSIAQQYTIEDKVIKIGVSIGIAHYPQDSRNKEELIAQADQAMYHSKNEGRNQLTFYRS